MDAFDLQILSLLLPKGHIQAGALVTGFLSVCREPQGGASCVPACKGARKSVFLNQTASKIAPDPSASQSWSDTDTLHLKALGEGLHTHLLCIDLHQEQLSLGHASAELPVSDNSLTPFLATHQLSSLSMSFWADSLPGYAMASTIPLAFSREYACGLSCECRVVLLKDGSPGVEILASQRPFFPTLGETLGHSQARIPAGEEKRDSQRKTLRCIEDTDNGARPAVLAFHGQQG